VNGRPVAAGGFIEVLAGIDWRFRPYQSKVVDGQPSQRETHDEVRCAKLNKLKSSLKTVQGVISPHRMQYAHLIVGTRKNLDWEAIS